MLQSMFCYPVNLYNFLVYTVQLKLILRCFMCFICSNVIDVAQLDSQQVEQQEYLDRARQYT